MGRARERWRTPRNVTRTRFQAASRTSSLASSLFPYAAEHVQAEYARVYEATLAQLRRPS